MNLQMHTPFSNLHYYRLEPHDGIRYEFFFFDPVARLASDLLETWVEQQSISSNKHPRTQEQIPIKGIRDGQGYVMLGITAGGKQGFAPVLRNVLSEIQDAWHNNDESQIVKLIANLGDTFNGNTGMVLHCPTITICLLALSVLIFNPQALENAVDIAHRGIHIHKKIIEYSLPF